MSDNITTLNGKPVTKEELEEKKKEIAGKKGVQLVEVAPNNYRTRILG